MLDWEVLKRIKGFPGMLREHEGEILAKLAEGKIVLEIGSYFGLSTLCMAPDAKRVHTIDWGCGDPQVDGGFTPPLLLANLKKYEQLQKVVVHVGRSEHICPLFQAETFDMVFIDGAHDLESALMDIKMTTRLLKDGGTLVLHDFELPGVKQAMEQSGLKGGFTNDRLWWTTYNEGQ
jgi:predicted O-methyltransferase YrrM